MAAFESTSSSGTIPPLSSFERDIQFALGSNFPGGFRGERIFGQLQQQQQSFTAAQVERQQQESRAQLRRMASPNLSFDCGSAGIAFVLDSSADITINAAPGIAFKDKRETPWQAFCRELRAEMADWFNLELN